MILENEKAAAVGSNKVHQVSHLAPQLFENQTIVSVQNSKDLKIDSFSSAVCVFDPGKKVPVTLYGGENVSAAINSDGTIIFTNQKDFFFAHLPDNEKAIQLACTN
ncbi:hypothetical protein M9Y10_040432 [Tritrichomonas musculus]|uniref:Uncharacterized protein n=1 Tax=Tritrichomonas musculus TaxID=1915356 RepID=A0ABR2GPJ6_9EUKA